MRTRKCKRQLTCKTIAKPKNSKNSAKYSKSNCSHTRRANVTQRTLIRVERASSILKSCNPIGQFQCKVNVTPELTNGIIGF